jgi:uncharacterized protein YqgV (UPF0045/DUF77 family)
VKQHKVTIEISMYPLTSNYEEAIIPFIQSLKKREGITIKTNAMSTYVQGEFTHVWQILGEEFSKAFDAGIPMSNVLKIIPRDLPVAEGWLDF